MSARLFEDLPEPRLLRDALGPGTAILTGFALGIETELVSALKTVVKRAPGRLGEVDDAACSAAEGVGSQHVDSVNGYRKHGGGRSAAAGDRRTRQAAL